MLALNVADRELGQEGVGAETILKVAYIMAH